MAIHAVCRSSARLSAALLVGSLLVFAACGGGGGAGEDVGTEATSGTEATAAETGSPTEPTGSTGSTGGAELPAGCDVFVAPGPDDQATLQGALIDAVEGSTVCMGAGVFMLDSELSISVDGVTLRGTARDATILDFSLQDLGANGIKISGDDVTVTAFTVRETPGDGIRGDDVDNVTYEDIAVEWAAKESMENGAYGLYPVGCDGVTIRKARVFGARDAGIYVGQSKNIVVEDSEAHDNVAGIELENSSAATVRNNHAYANTAGILIFNLPGLPVQDGKHTVAYGNTVEDNNGANFGVPGTVVAGLPVGVGFMILAADANELRGNTVRDNDTAGVIILSYNEAFFEPPMDPGFNAYPAGNYVHDNVFAGNGAAPDPALAPLFGTPAPDMLYDGCPDPGQAPDPALVNCFFMNGAATFMNFDLCGGLMDQSTDLSPFTCQHSELPDLPGG